MEGSMRFCPTCGKSFIWRGGRQSYCSSECREFHKNEMKRLKRAFESQSRIGQLCGAVTNLEDEAIISKKYKTTPLPKADYVSVKDAAIILGVSRPTIYRKIEAGEIHPIRISTKTVRISKAELLVDSQMEQVANTADFTHPIRLDEALERYSVSRSKFFSTIRKAGIRSKRVDRIEYYPRDDMDQLFTLPLKYDPEAWYTIEDLLQKTSFCQKYILDFARAHGITVVGRGKNAMIERKTWDLQRFDSGQLGTDFFTVDDAKKYYQVGQERFYREVNAAGIDRHRDGCKVYFKKKDLDKLFADKSPKIPPEIRRECVSAKEALNIYHIGQKRFSEETKANNVTKTRVCGFMWYRKDELDKLFGRPKKR